MAGNKGTDIGTAWINIVPSFQDMGEGIAKELGLVDKKVPEHTSSWGTAIKEGLGSAFQAVGTMAVAGLAAAGGFIASYTGEALAASDATDKFKSTLNFAGLDSSVIDDLTASTQAYADKTVYDLSDIQMVTAQLASNGVEGYAQLAEAAGNLNAVAGGNKETFKSVAMVLTQTAGAGKLTTENWRQLTDAIPGAAGPLKQALLDAGAYTGDFSKALSDGQISADEFNKAITDLGLTDVASEAATSTATFEGAWGNLEAAITGGLVKIIEPLKGPLTDALSGIADSLTPVFDAIGTGIDSLVNGGGLDEFTGMLGGAAPVVGLLAGALGPLLTQLPLIGGGFAGLTGPIGLAVGAFIGVLQNSESLRDALVNLGAAILPALEPLGGVFVQLVEAIGPLLGQIGDGLAPIIAALTPIVTAVVEVIVQLVSQMMGSLLPVLSQVGDLFVQIGTYIAPVIEWLGAMLIPAIQALGTAVGVVFDNIMTVISGALTFIQGLIQTVGALITGDWSGVWTGIQTMFSGVWTAIQGIVSAALNAIGGIISAGLNLISGVFSGVWSALVTLVSNTWNSITSAISSGVNSAVSYVQQLPSKISNIFSGAGNWLVSAGKSIIDGFINGIKSAFGAVQSTLGSLTDMLPSWKGPEDLDKVILKDAGRLVIGGFVTGMESQYAAARDSLSRFTSSLAPSMSAPAAPTGWSGNGGLPETLTLRIGEREFTSYLEGETVRTLRRA